MSQERNLQPLIGIPRTFPVRLPVVDGELLLSYVIRLSARHDVNLGQTISRLGLVTEIRDRPLPGFGIVMSDDNVKTFSFVSGLSETQTRSLLLNRYAGIAGDFLGASPISADSIRKASVREWAYFSGSHFCPQCLKESEGAWSLVWKLPWSFACAKHKVLLHDHCPECGGRAFNGRKDGSLSPAFTGKIPVPGTCGNVLPTGQANVGKGSMPCQCDLRNIDSFGLDGCDELIATQKTINEYLSSPDLISSGKSLVFFNEMRSVAALILYRAEVEDFPSFQEPIQEAIALHIDHRNATQSLRTQSGLGRNGVRVSMYTGAPKSALLMAAVSHVALSIVQITDQGLLQNSLRVLAERTIDRSPKYRYAVLNNVGFSERLRTAFAGELATKGTFDRRAGHLSNVQTRIDGRSNSAELPKYEAKHVPQCIPESIFNRDFKEFFPNVRDQFARRFCSLAAVKRLGYTWIASAEFLDQPKSMYGMANRCVMLLNQQGHYDQFAESLYKWTKTIAKTKVHIDYAQRRDVLRNFVEFPDDQWLQICSDSGVSKGKIGGRSKYAATWLWAEMTGGDWALAPALAAHISRTNQHAVYKIFVKTLLPKLMPALLAYGKIMQESVITQIDRT
jgi:hypothetical protein